MTTILVSLIIGGTAGLLAGMFGIGGGIVIVPMLMAFLKFPQSKAVGTSLGAMLLPVGFLAFRKYSQNGDVNWKVSLAVALGLFIMALVGASVGLKVGDTWISKGFGVLLIAVGIKFLFFVR